MSSGRVAALDGLRGIAVLLVIAGHFVSAVADTDEPLPRALLVPANGGIGVTLFFVLSGYLITSILVREKDRTGRVHFGNFYIRRTLRIWPAYYVFLGVVTVLAATDVVAVTGGQIVSAGAFVWNYSPAADGWWLGHTWSLAVEEQFYLLWPVALVVLGARRAVLLAAVYVVATPAIRTLSYALLPEQRGEVWMMFHTRADALLIGCLLALLPTAYPAHWERLQRLAQRHRTEYVAVAALLASSALELRFGGLWVLPFGYAITAVAAGLLVLVVVARQAPSPLMRALRWRVFTTVGLISYSLYLWQQLFLAPRGASLPVVSGVLGLVALFAVAALSYVLIERPFLGLKDRLQRTPHRAVAAAGDTGDGPTSGGHMPPGSLPGGDRSDLSRPADDGAAPEDRGPIASTADNRGDEDDPALSR